MLNNLLDTKYDIINYKFFYNNYYKNDDLLHLLMAFQIVICSLDVKFKIIKDNFLIGIFLKKNHLVVFQICN